MTVLSHGNVWYMIEDQGTVTLPTWTPSSLSNLIGWYDAMDDDTITRSGNVVSDWLDKSSSDQDLNNTDASRRPFIHTDTIQGRQALEFFNSDYLVDENFAIPASGNMSISIHGFKSKDHYEKLECSNFDECSIS